MSARSTGNLTPVNGLRSPFPQGLNAASGASEGLLTLVGQGVSFTSIDRRQPLSHQTSFGFQHDLRGVLVEASYVGTFVRDLPVSQQTNFIPEEFRSAAEQTFFATGRNILNLKTAVRR